jgi:DNA-binding NarL/FixJ family response regulator
MTKNVIAYEDDPVLRKQLQNMFYALREEYLLLETFEDPSDVEGHLAIYKPDIVIMDIQMRDDDDGLNALYRIKRVNKEMKVMMLTTFDVDDTVFNAICLGADGYMLKTDLSSYHAPHETMRRSLRIIFDGGAYLTPTVAKKILRIMTDQTIGEKFRSVTEKFTAIFKRQEENSDGVRGLSRMQKMVLQKIVEGLTTPEIAVRLGLSENTINSHIKAIYHLMEVHSRAQVIKKALQEKWV